MQYTKRADLDTIIFDVGNVLIRYDPLGYLRSVHEAALAERIYAAVFGSKHWLEMDRGVLNETEIKARMAADAPDVAEFIAPAIADYDRVISPMAESVAYLPRLKAAGYKLYVLSNYGASYFAQARARYQDIFALFDGLVISGEELMIKPMPGIYHLILERYGLTPARTMFVDDSAANIRAAEKVGLQGMVFTNPTQLEALLVATRAFHPILI